MAYIRYKTIGSNRYAYEVTAVWDPKLKQSRSKSAYLGVVDDNGNIIRKTSANNPSRLQLDFGDGFLIYSFINKSVLYPILLEVFGKKAQSLIALISYRLCIQSAMYNASIWQDGNVAKILFKEVDLSSQSISRILFHLSKEEVQRAFFKEYLLKTVKSDSSIIIDATSLPNQIDTGFNAWGHGGGSIDKQFRFLCVIDQLTNLPLFYRYLPGNISDIITLEQTIAELKELGISNSFALVDAGYVSESNIKILYELQINFLTRLPSSRKIYKNLIREYGDNLEKRANAVSIGRRGLFVKMVKIDLYGHEGFAYIVLDPVRKGKEMSEKILDISDDKVKGSDSFEDYNNCGIMILVSSTNIPANEVVTSYYTRQSIEQVFGFFKEDLDSLPIRRHNDNTVRGYLFLQFITLIIFIDLRKKLEKKYTVEKAILHLKNLKCKLFNSHLLVAETTKAQKEIFNLCGIIVPKKFGI